MQTPEWLKELRAWLGTAALLGLLVLVYFYLKHAEADRRDREVLLKAMQETSPEERVERLKKLAKEKAAQERADREAERQ
jgi:hypothetical protein